MEKFRRCQDRFKDEKVLTPQGTEVVVFSPKEPVLRAVDRWDLMMEQAPRSELGFDTPYVPEKSHIVSDLPFPCFVLFQKHCGSCIPL